MPSPSPNGAGHGGQEDASSQSPSASDVAALDAILTTLCRTSQGCPPSREQEAWAAKRKQLRAGTMSYVEVRMLLRDHESRFQRTADEARQRVSRDARAARRTARDAGRGFAGETTPGDPPSDDDDCGHEEGSATR